MTQKLAEHVAVDKIVSCFFMSAITQHSCYDGFFDVVTATLEPTSFSVNTHTQKEV